MKTESNKYGFSGKWSPEIEQYGFTQVPNLLLSCQGHLGLKDGELTTLLQLLTFWFEHDGKVYPSIVTLARYPSKGYSTIQKRLKSLEEKGFIKRHRKLGSSNTYNMKLCARQLYEHQKVCKDLPRRRSVSKVKVKYRPASYTTSKQYEPKRLNSKDTKGTLSAILAKKYGTSTWPTP
ncbi:helix-turn-helix domain-containing protein [Candidatus Saccharibacteria bacterium]|nr:helix-turn-helix domain-containing protein [Candidatus Saccharibacteria bacterium]